MPETVTILPQTFQQFNPFFVVVLTPVSLVIFGYLANKKKEPSAPRKDRIGYDDRRLRFLDLGDRFYGLAYTGRFSEGIQANCRYWFLELVDIDLSGIDLRRIIAFSDGYLFRIQSGSSLNTKV